jgi:hypothetical protein
MISTNSAAKRVDLSCESEHVPVDSALDHDEPIDELIGRDVGGIVDLPRQELQNPGKIPKACVELFIDLFLKDALASHTQIL